MVLGVFIPFHFSVSRSLLLSAYRFLGLRSKSLSVSDLNELQARRCDVEGGGVESEELRVWPQDCICPFFLCSYVCNNCVVSAQDMQIDHKCEGVGLVPVSIVFGEFVGTLQS